MRKMKITPKGVTIRCNTEAGMTGECEALVNMREREESLQVVGDWAKVGILSIGEVLMLIDHRQDADYYITARGKSIYRHGMKAGRKYEQNDAYICELDAAPEWMQAVGDFVVIGTQQGYRYLLFKKGEYGLINLNDAIPQLVLSAVNIADIASTLHGESFEETYQSWDNPLEEKDYKALHAKVKSVYGSLLAKAEQSGSFVQPVAVRYAVRLWDDSYVWVSAPVVLGCGIQAGGWHSIAVDSSLASYADSELSMKKYNIGVSMVKSPLAEWLPLIKSVDIMVSGEMNPFFDDRSISCRCETSQTSASSYYLSFKLEQKERIAAVGELVNPDKWNVMARITDVASLTTEPVAVQRCDIYDLSVDRAVIADIVSDINHEVAANAGLSLNGRLYSAGHKRRMRNAWESVQYWSGSMANTPCEVIVTVKLSTIDGDAVKADKHAYDYTPQSLNALVAYPDARAKEITIKVLSDNSIKEWTGKLVGIDSQGMAYFLNDDMVANEFATGYSFYLPTERNIEATAFTEFTVSRNGNPLVVEQCRNVGNGAVTCLAVAAKSIYSNVFGRYPVYAFATDGIYAIAYKELGDYKDSQLIGKYVLASPATVAMARDKVYFVSTDGELCVVSGKTVEVVRLIESVSQAVWTKVFGELLIKHDEGNVSAVMPNGRSYERTEQLAAVYGDCFEALAADSEGNLIDLNDETASVRAVRLHTHPIAVADDELVAPLSLSFNMTSGNGSSCKLELKGSDGTACDWRILREITLEGLQCHPVTEHVFAPPCRLLSIYLAGNMESGTLFRNVVLRYI